MHPIRFIRTEVLGLSQAELAALTGVRQGTVSRWEAGALDPSLGELRRIRDEARRRGLRWNDGWFFGDAPLGKRSA